MIQNRLDRGYFLNEELPSLTPANTFYDNEYSQWYAYNVKDGVRNPVNLKETGRLRNDINCSIKSSLETVSLYFHHNEARNKKIQKKQEEIGVWRPTEQRSIVRKYMGLTISERMAIIRMMKQMLTS